MRKLENKVPVYGFDPDLGVLVHTGALAASPGTAKAAMTRNRFVVTDDPKLRMVNTSMVRPWTAWVVPVAPGHPWAKHPQNKGIRVVDATRENAGSAYTDPLMWEHAKREAVRRLGGRHSARAMQLAGRLYREAGGGYRGPRTAAQRSMARWTEERWTTATGEKACRQTPRGVRCDRYLPAKAWEELSPREIASTRRVKLGATRQYVANTPEAKAAARKAKRRRSGGQYA